MKAVLQELASAVRNGIEPSAAAGVVVVVLEPLAVDHDRARALRGGVGRQPRAQQREAADGLEGRTGRELAEGRHVVAVGARPVGRGEDRAGGRLDRDQRAGRADTRQQPLGRHLQPRVEGQLQRLARRRVLAEQLLLPAVGRHLGHDHAGRADQLLVVAQLEAGQPDLLADGVALGVVLDHLGGGLADGAEDRGGELAGRRERQRVPDRERALDPRVALPQLGRHVLTPQHDRLDEGGLAGRLHPLDVRRRVDVDERREGPRGPGRARRRHRRLVDPEPGDRPVGHQRLAAGTEDLAAGGGDAAQVEDAAGPQRRLDDRGLPLDRPRLVDEGQRRLGGVGPVLLAHRPRPAEGRGHGVAALVDVADLGDRDRRGELPHPLDDRGVVLRDGRVPGEGDVGQVTGGQPVGERGRDRLRVGTGVLLEGAGAGRQEKEGTPGDVRRMPTLLPLPLAGAQ